MLSKTNLRNHEQKIAKKTSEVKLQGVVLFPHRGDVVQGLTERKPPIAKLIKGHEMAQISHALNGNVTLDF